MFQLKSHPWLIRPLDNILLVLGAKDEECAGLWHGYRLLLQLQVGHGAGPGDLRDVRVLLLIVTWAEEQVQHPNTSTLKQGSIWVEWFEPGSSPGKSAGGNGSLISLTLDSNSSILSCGQRCGSVSQNDMFPIFVWDENYKPTRDGPLQW